MVDELVDELLAFEDDELFVEDADDDVEPAVEPFVVLDVLVVFEVVEFVVVLDASVVAALSLGVLF